MTRRDPNGHAYSGTTINIDPDGSSFQPGALATSQNGLSRVHHMPVATQGRYYDARSKTLPVYVVDPGDRRSGFLLLRAILSYLRHCPLAAIATIVLAIYGLQFGLAALTNLLRPDPKFVDCGGLACLNPVELGSNVSGWSRVTLLEPTATSLGDSVIGTSATKPANNRIRSARATVAR